MKWGRLYQMSNFGFIINNSIVRSFTTNVFIQTALTGHSIYYLRAVWSYIYTANTHLYMPDPDAVSLFLVGRVHRAYQGGPDRIINQRDAISDNWIWVSFKAFKRERAEELCVSQRETPVTLLTLPSSSGFFVLEWTTVIDSCNWLFSALNMHLYLYPGRLWQLHN